MRRRKSEYGTAILQKYKQQCTPADCVRMTRNLLWVEAIVLTTAADSRFRQAIVLLVFLIGGIGQKGGNTEHRTLQQIGEGAFCIL